MSARRVAHVRASKGARINRLSDAQIRQERAESPLERVA